MIKETQVHYGESDPTTSPSAASGGAKKMATRKPTIPTMMADKVVRRSRRAGIGAVFEHGQWFLEETPDLLTTLTTAATVPNTIPINRPAGALCNSSSPETEQHPHRHARRNSGSHHRKRGHPREVRATRSFLLRPKDPPARHSSRACPGESSWFRVWRPGDEAAG